MQSITVNVPQPTADYYKLSVKRILLIFNFLLLFYCFHCFSQGVSINKTGTSADNSAILDINSTSQGLLIPRITSIQRDNITAPATSLFIFNTTTNCFEAYVNSSWYPISCPSPSPSICSQFQKTYGGNAIEEAITVQQTIDGGYIIGGNSNSWGGGGNDIYIVKTDDKGDLLWSKTFGSTGNDYTYSVRQTKDGGYIIGGTTSSFGAGGYDFYLVKTDASGNLLWNKTFGGSGNEYAYLVQQTSDGGYIIAGNTNSFGAGGDDFYLVKTDVNGNLSWSKTYGGSGNDWAYSVKQASDGGYIIAGTTFSFGAGNNDFYLVRTDGSGNLLWNKTYGGTGRDFARSVEQTSDGGFIIGGNTTSFGITGMNDYLVKTDASGDLSWNSTFGGTVGEVAFSVQQTRDGGFMIAGYTQSFRPGLLCDYYLVKTDVNGNLSWSNSYGGTLNNYGYFAQQTTDGGYIFAGITTSFGAGSRDFYLIKTDESGNAGGCNTTIPPTNSTSPASTVTVPSTSTSAPATVVTIPSPIITSPTTTVNILCTKCK
jgi:hypothetical protein